MEIIPNDLSKCGDEGVICGDISMAKHDYEESSSEELDELDELFNKQDVLDDIEQHIRSTENGDIIKRVYSDPNRLGKSNSLAKLYQQTYPWEADGLHAVLEVIVQSNGFEKNGFFLLVNKTKKYAKIVPFIEESFYSSLSGIRDHRCIWQGSIDELVHISDNMLDLNMNGRKIQSDDFDYATWDELYSGVRAWRDQGFPLWIGGMQIYGTREYWSSHKTPIAARVAHEWKQKQKAATLIQATYRAWKWRLNVLWNPNTDIGYKYLQNNFKNHME
jgi:hypothetical protein